MEGSHMASHAGEAPQGGNFACEVHGGSNLI
jgi:hypothetical protein